MAFNLLGNPGPNTLQSLLGEYYDPRQARMRWIGGTLQGLGMGLATGRPGAWAEGAIAGGGQGIEDYQRQALAQYGIKERQDERADQNAWRQKMFDYRVTQDEEERARQEKADAWASTFNQAKLDELQRADDIRTGQENAVTDWTQNFQSQGGDLFGPGMQSWLRGQGVQGVNPADTQRYNAVQPYARAGMYPEAFQQMTAETSAMQPNWKETTLEDGVYWIDQNNPQNRQKIGERPNRNEGEGRDFTQEGKLRAEYVKEAKPFTDLRVNYQKILASAQDNTGASDIAMVYSFMKMLDPTSVVREGEFATAENAGGVPTQIMTMYNRALTGERLAPEIRQQFLQQAGRQYEQQMQTYTSIREQFKGLAEQYGVDPERVAPDLAFGVVVQNASETPAPPAEARKVDPKNPQPGDVVLGYRFKGGNRRDPKNWEKVQ